jgi:hypothetical protein
MKTSIYFFLAVSLFISASCSKSEIEVAPIEIKNLEQLKAANINYGELIPLEYDFSKSTLQGIDGKAYSFYPTNSESKQNLFVIKDGNEKGVPEQDWYGTLIIQEFGSGYLIGCAGDANNCMEVEVDGRTWIVMH